VRLDGLTSPALGFILGEKFDKCGTVNIGKARSLIGAEQRPVSIFFDALHAIARVSKVFIAWSMYSQ
jgi:hypothetical protein